MLVLSRGPEEAIVIGGKVEVQVLEVRGDRVRLGIIAPGEIPVHRKEVFLNIQKENRAAAAAEAAGLEGALDMLGASAPRGAGSGRDRREARGAPAAGKTGKAAGRGGPARGEREPKREKTIW